MLQNQKQVKKQFLKQLEITVIEANISYIEAILLLCERNHIDIEQAAQYVISDKNIRDKLEADATALNFLKRE